MIDLLFYLIPQSASRSDLAEFQVIECPAIVCFVDLGILTSMMHAGYATILKEFLICFVCFMHGINGLYIFHF